MNIKFFIKIIILVVILISIVTVGIIGGAALAYKFFDEETVDINGDGIIDDNDIVDSKEGSQTNSIGQRIQNVMLLAVDAEGYRTDVIILAQYNYETKEIHMLQIPRDTKISTNRSDKKINAAYAFGKEQELFAVMKRTFNIDVDKYVLVNIDGFRDIVDEIGGVDFNVPVDMYYNDPYQNLSINLKKGMQHLDGDKAEQLVRYRKYSNADLGRMEVQKQFMMVVIDKMLSVKNVFKIPKLAAILIRNVKTNFDLMDITKYLEIGLNMDKDKINIMKLPGDAQQVNGAWYFIHEQKKTEETINKFFLSKEEGINGEESVNNVNNVNNNIKTVRIEDIEDYKSSILNKLIKVEVLNSSDNPKAGEKTAEFLKKCGYRVVHISDYKGEKLEVTKIIDRTNKENGENIQSALEEIGELSKEVEDSDVHVTIIVGNDIIF